MTEIEIRRYRASDAAAIVRLYYDTIHAVNAADYGPAQLDAWAPEIPDTAAWHDRMSRRCTLVAEEAGVLAGFVELAADGHLDMLFCAEHAVGRGVGAALYAAAERQARDWRLGRIFTEASITARGFFIRQGFRVLQAQSEHRRGVELGNFAMAKDLAVD
jgi:GNAT superfamily N-acetyltransferase